MILVWCEGVRVCVCNRFLRNVLKTWCKWMPHQRRIFLQFLQPEMSNGGQLILRDGTPALFNSTLSNNIQQQFP